MRQEDGKIVVSSRELEEALASVQQTLAQFAELGGRNLLPDPSIPLTFTKVCTVAYPEKYALSSACKCLHREHIKQASSLHLL